MRKTENISRESFPSLSKNSSGGDNITLADSLELTSNFMASRGHCKTYLLMAFLAPPPATPHILVGRETNKGKFSSVQFSRSVLPNSLRPHESQHTRPPCPSPAPEVCSNSYPSSHWCHPAISPSVIPFSSCPQSLPASGSSQCQIHSVDVF